MADAKVTPGSSTSEFKLTAVVVFLGAALDVAGIVLDAIKDAGVSTGAWVPVSALVVGTLLMLLAKLGYTRSRTLVKIAEATASKGVPALSASTPFVQELVGILRSEMAKPAAPASATPPPAA